MKYVSAAGFALVAALTTICASANRLRSESQVNPVSQVISLLEDLKAKVIADGEKEQKAFTEYSAWCKDGAKDKEFEIKTATDDINDMEATINQANSVISSSSSKIEDLGNSISESEADLKAQTKMRETENGEFIATEEELVDAINTLERAINLLERKLKGSALLQAKVNKKDVTALIHVLSEVVEAAGLASHDREQLLSLAQGGVSEDEDDVEADLSLGAPAAAAYTSHSGNIIDALEDLKQKAEAQLNVLRNEEMNAKHNYEMTKQTLEDQIKFDTKELGDAKVSKATAKENKAVAEGELEVTKKNLEAAKNVLQNMATDCRSVATDHEETVKSRAEEIKVLEQAIAVLKDTTQGAVAETYTPAFFLQVGATHGQVNFDVVNMVRKLARDQQSPQLTQLATRISAAVKEGATSGEDPFAKVKKMISDMLTRLEEDAAQEASHKAYCDKEMGETQTKMDELKHDIDKYTTQIDKAKAESARLKDEVATLQGQIAKIMKTQAEADKVRQDEHTAYTLSKADLEQGLQGVRMALKVLREYYASGETDAFLQQSNLAHQPDMPELHEKGAGTGTSVIGLLEVVESDFGKNLAGVEVEEETAATSYQKLSMENKMAKAMKENDVKYKTKEAATLDQKVTGLSSDLESAQTELDAVLEYSTNIRGMCEIKPESYEDRAERRSKEIAGLKEALEVLEGQAVLLQRRRVLRGSLQHL